VEFVQEAAASGQHLRGIPRVVPGPEGDYAALGSRFNAAPARTDVDGDVVDGAGYQHTDQAPELPDEQVIAAIGGADEVASSDRQAVDLVFVDHP
jgi:hypothetical protein